ncbi:hypothetical protein TIFTF001_023188 [Ficus carica]|uniref:Uncharacterized protein n=1 Tax=Ficus carica TaxID=3494 RepID=A0AA88AFR9_FICCA|nr:hypothetical protein TIFTF001_023188 [Ficus carica]
MPPPSIVSLGSHLHSLSSSPSLPRLHSLLSSPTLPRLPLFIAATKPAVAYAGTDRPARTLEYLVNRGLSFTTRFMEVNLVDCKLDFR